MNQPMTRTQALASAVMRYSPDARARVQGGPEYPEISGELLFYEFKSSVLVVAEVKSLPEPGGACAHPVFALHIHEGKSCTGTPENPFADAKGHYNPEGCAHPFHAGDLPPLFSNRGTAWCAVLTDRFRVSEIIGRVVIVHLHPDDFTTQPSGNSGPMIACGSIVAAGDR